MPIQCVLHSNYNLYSIGEQSVDHVTQMYIDGFTFFLRKVCQTFAHEMFIWIDSQIS